MRIGPREQGPEGYQIYTHNGVKAVGGIFFGCWWLSLAYMTFSSRKEGLASYVMAYGFFAFASLIVVHTVCDVVRTKFVVTDKTITRYFPLIPPKTYAIGEITKVVIHRGRGRLCSYRVYMGKKKVFELDDTMVNLGLFLTALRERQVPFMDSIL